MLHIYTFAKLWCQVHLKIQFKENNQPTPASFQIFVIYTHIKSFFGFSLYLSIKGKVLKLHTAFNLFGKYPMSNNAKTKQSQLEDSCKNTIFHFVILSKPIEKENYYFRHKNYRNQIEN